MTFTIAAVVEGQGDRAALPVLLRRIANEAHVFDIKIPEPILLARSKMLDPREVARACQLAAQRIPRQGCILVLLDSDDDCAVRLSKQIRSIVPRIATLLVVAAVREYESIFLAGSRPLYTAGKFDQPYVAGNPEQPRGAKGLVAHLTVGGVYRETVHQAKFSAVVSLDEARGCRWFRKLEKDVLGLLGV